MLLIEEIYSRALEIVASLEDLNVNERELVLFYALRVLQHNALIEEIIE